ncbi:MAG: double-strand break repair protein AddB, partial [Xanthobacteraceae bacterium]
RLELVALRGPRPAAGAEGLAAAVAAFDPASFHRTDPRAGLDAAACVPAAELAARVGGALGPLLALGSGPQPFAALVAAHHAAMLAAGPPAGEAVEALELAFEALAAGAPFAPELTLAAYAEALPALLAGGTVRPAFAPAVRLRILGPLEARLVAVDRMVLGGLVEDTWPAAARTDPWLSRPMRAALGLEPPERRIGLAAHDFAQGCGAPELVLTRPAKLGGAPTVPSRFLQRLAAVSGAERWAAAVARGNRLRRLTEALDHDPPVPRVKRPAPTPAVGLRPTRLSVTEIETWLRDPYSIYARHVLRLRPLAEHDETPGGAERGTALHGALGSFAQAYPKALPEDALARLIEAGRGAFAPLEAFPAEHAVWWARFTRLAAWYIAWERERRPPLDRLTAEVGGSLNLPGTRGPFVLTARADRIEIGRDGALRLIDFKTGTVPTPKQTAALYSPQLALEAAMARRGAFRDVPPGEVADITYVRLGGGMPPVAEKPAIDKGWTAQSLAEATLERLEELVRAFENPAQGYLALRRPMFRNRFGDYDHLARVGEWSVGGEGEGE